MLFVLARLLNRVRAEEEEEGTLTGRKRPDADARSNISSRVYVDQREDRNDRRYILRFFFFFFFSFLYLSPLIYFFHSQSGSSSGVGRVSGQRFLVSSPSSLSLSFSLECIYKIYSIVVTAQIKYSSSNNNRDKKKKKKKIQSCVTSDIFRLQKGQLASLRPSLLATSGGYTTEQKQNTKFRLEVSTVAFRPRRNSNRPTFDDLSTGTKCGRCGPRAACAGHWIWMFRADIRVVGY